VTVDERGQILRANRPAEIILTSAGGVGVRNDYLHIERASVQRSFQDMLERVASGSVEQRGAGPTVLGIPDRTGAIRYALRVVSTDYRETGAEILLAVVDFNDRSGPSRSTVSTVFRLSAREAELAELFSQGLGLEAIAETMGIALNTARVHLRNIFQKTSCSTQLELFRRLTRLTATDWLSAVPEAAEASLRTRGAA
jgi:DNA-binding CsgD family transcriptional regulator